MNTKRLKKSIAISLTFALVFASVLTGADGAYAKKKQIKLNKNKATLDIGATVKLSVKNAPKKSVITYKVNKPAIIKVSKKGVVSGLKAGSAKVTVRVSKKNKKLIKKLTCQITVRKVTPANPTETPYSPEVSKKFVGDKNGKISKEFTDQSIDFSVNLFKTSVKEDLKNGKNVLVSPLSVLTDLMMATNGADQATKEELVNVMCGKVGFENFRKTLSDYNAGLIYSDPVRFHIANSIWIRDEGDRIVPKQEFLDDGEKWFNATSEVLPFDQAMVEKVNAWVKKNTLGMIEKLLDKVPESEDVMHLINALAFEGAWASPYNEKFQVIKDQTFTNALGKKETATMLTDSVGVYKHDDQAEGFERYYKGGEYSFVTILPNEGVDLNKYLSELDGSKFAAFYNSDETGYEVHTKIPEFSYDYNRKLNDDLKAMGIKEAFKDTADFTKMAETKTTKLFIGSVTHKTHIELDKNGTKAAAVTDIGMADATSIDPSRIKHKYIYLDRPFIYAIVQTKTGIPIFMGVVNSLQ